MSKNRNIIAALTFGVSLFFPLFSLAADHKRDKIMEKAASEMTRALDVSSSGIENVTWDGNYFVFRLDFQSDFVGFSGSGEDGYQFIRSEFMDPLMNDFRKSEMARLLVNLNAGMKIILPLSDTDSSDCYEFIFSPDELRLLSDGI